MKRFFLATALALAIAAPAVAQPAWLEKRAEALRVASGSPGLSIAVVENGKVVLARGFGVRRMGSPEKVDADTIFMIGSTSKAFTAASIATLVDAGKLKWDDKVVDHLPGFQMFDPWVTREMTVRDLLVHRSGLGLGAGDLLYIPRGNRSRPEIMQRLRYIPPATSFRDGYAYDNILYVVAGLLVEAVSGQSWEDYVRDHLFRPAGMLTAASEQSVQLTRDNRAQPHGRVGGPVRGSGPQRVLDERDRLAQASAPAGLLALGANDMGRWIQIQLAHGAIPGGGRLFSEASALEMWTPVTLMPNTTPPSPIEGTAATYQAYALGWQVRDYRGHRILYHSGGLFGFTSVVVLIPELNTGFAIELNSEEIEPRFGLMYELLDHYLGLPRQDWGARFGAYRRDRIAAAEAAVKTQAARPAASRPSLALVAYAGRYADPWYGAMTVGSDAKGLTVNFEATPGMTGRLEHFQYDTFIVRFDDPAIEAAYLTFALDADGKVATIRAKPVSPIADFSFDYQDLLFTPAPAR